MTAFGYVAPEVRWVQDPTGHHPEPPPDSHVSAIEKLRYDAALTEARCGVRCRIGQINGPDVYDYVVYSADGAFVQSGNCGTYWEAREFLHGIEVGAKAV